ncbi:hypothetical protein AALO_G00130210 [Alosa alosa]|uniref:Uncharacterized protein n=1 Tax=Alosa alosa TaxID=278164 RepID=A0AAV6GQS7_9TELE|nr:hypothetical protein AALO_G00130210 [Alosa alosa]
MADRTTQSVGDPLANASDVCESDTCGLTGAAVPSRQTRPNPFPIYKPSEKWKVIDTAHKISLRSLVI